MEISELQLTPIEPQDDGTFKIGHSRVTRAQLEQMRDHINAALAGEPPKPKPAPKPEPVAYVRKLQNGQIAVVSPYSELVKVECKRLMGKWSSFNKTQADGTKKSVDAWILDGSHEDAMRAFLAEIFDAPVAEKVITFQSDESDEVPSIDGQKLLSYFNRDNRAARVQHDFVVILEIIEDTLKTGGSARYPTLRGTLKIRARVRDNAVIEWSGGTVTVEDVNAGA